MYRHSGPYPFVTASKATGRAGQIHPLQPEREKTGFPRGNKNGGDTRGGRNSGETAYPDRRYCQLKCHDASGEIYYVTFSRTKVRVSSYSDDAIRSTVDAWADEKAKLS